MPRSTSWGIPDRDIVQVSPHTFAFYAPRYPFSNSAIVVGNEGVLVFDANDVSCGRELHAAVKQYGAARPLRYLILSHPHSDHVHGAHFFAPPAKALGRAFTQERLQYWVGRDLQPFIDEAPHYAEEYRNLRIVTLEETIEAVRTLDLGELHVRLEPVTTAHSPGDLFAVVEEDGIALCGDLLFSRCAAYIGNGSLAGSLAALVRLRELGVSQYLPGHGPIGGIGALDGMEEFLVDMQETVRAAKSVGVQDAAIVADVVRRMTPRWQHLPFFLEPWLMPDNVPIVVRELEGHTS